MSIESIFPIERSLTIADVDFKIREFQAREFPVVISLASKLSGVSQADIAQLIETQTDDIFKLVAAITAHPKADIERLRPAVLLQLIEAIIEENLDFFVLQLPQTIQRLGSKVTGTMQSNS